ncbi:MAG: GH3 auxin-responsive promoter family protein [Flavobacteriales bacterium]|nr:GH3 auxin-responsive promoter family protein [Flavobacteriales bacterium]
MPLFNSIFSWWMKKRSHQIELFLKYPNEVQNEWFEELINTARNTEFGKKHKFSKLNDISNFKTEVAVQDYDDLKPYVERLMNGEQNLLWPTETKWFAKSSGTTAARSKFIPVTKEALEECHYKGGKDMLSIYCTARPETQVFTGKTLMMGGSSQTIDPGTDSYQGDLSSIIIKNLPFWADILRTPDRETALMKDFELKLIKMVETTVHENVTSLSGVPSWMLILLNKILQETNSLDISSIWPNLEVFFHGGVAFTPYRSQFEELIRSSKMNYMETYNASEGFFGIEDLNHQSELLLMLDYGIYYEFAPIGEWDKKFPNTLTLDEVELYTNYAIIISTNAGLWRYKIGDTVQFTSKYPFRIKVSGRTKHFINAFGEEVIIDNAEVALKHACEITNATIEDYTAAPIYLTNKDAGKHQWLIEFGRNPNDLSLFTHELDKKLREVNSDYDAKRKGNMALELPLIEALPRHTFYEWMKSRNKLGSQNKVPRLSNDRTYVDDILKIASLVNL